MSPSSLLSFFFTALPSQKDRYLLLQASHVNLLRMAGRPKPKTPNWKYKDALETSNDNNLPETEKLDSPAVTCVNGSLIKDSLIQCHQ